MHPTNPHKPLRAYGDRQNDGMIQLSFVLEIPPSARAKEAAKQFAELHGLREALVTTMESCADGYSYFVVYGHSQHAIDASIIDVPEIRTAALSRPQFEQVTMDIGAADCCAWKKAAAPPCARATCSISFSPKALADAKRFSGLYSTERQIKSSSSIEIWSLI